jgi:hypothetical protein
VTRTFIDFGLYRKIKGDAGLNQIPVVIEDFFFEIPVENVIGVRGSDLVLQHNRNMHARRQEPFTKGILLNQAFEQFRTNAKIIQKRIAFDGRAEPEDALTAGAAGVQELQALSLFPLDVVRKAPISLNVVASRSLLFSEHAFKAR